MLPAGIAAPEHTVILAGAEITGIGLTVIVYVTGVPTQVPIAGVMVIVPVIAEEEELLAVNPGTCPVPLAASPMAVFELVQV